MDTHKHPDSLPRKEEEKENLRDVRASSTPEESVFCDSLIERDCCLVPITRTANHIQAVQLVTFNFCSVTTQNSMWMVENNSKKFPEMILFL